MNGAVYAGLEIWNETVFSLTQVNENGIEICVLAGIWDWENGIEICVLADIWDWENGNGISSAFYWEILNGYSTKINAQVLI